MYVMRKEIWRFSLRPATTTLNQIQQNVIGVLDDHQILI